MAKFREYDIEAMEEVYDLGKALASPVRLEMLQLLYDKSLIIGEIAKEMNLPASSAAFHAKILEKAGLNTVLGMGTVFVVLIFLAFLISLIKYIPPFVEKFTKKSPQPVQTATPVVAETAEEDTEYVDDLELVAVITAAIAAQTGTSTDGFVVRSIRRRPSNNWN